MTLIGMGEFSIFNFQFSMNVQSSIFKTAALDVTPSKLSESEIY